MAKPEFKKVNKTRQSQALALYLAGKSIKEVGKIMAVSSRRAGSFVYKERKRLLRPIEKRRKRGPKRKPLRIARHRHDSKKNWPLVSYSGKSNYEAMDHLAFDMPGGSLDERSN